MIDGKLNDFMLLLEQVCALKIGYIGQLSVTGNDHWEMTYSVMKTAKKRKSDYKLHSCMCFREYYFSEENLQRDFFLRRKMQVGGWIPISLIASFHRVQAMTQNVALIIEVGLKCGPYTQGRSS